jgi:heat-inducible transcriptional repressor
VEKSVLSEREQLILRKIVDAYVESATPVGSRTIARQMDLELSPATIRNTMMDLEEKGFLAQPHASAGRVPTDLGYRAYVNSLMEPEALTSQEEDWIDEQLEANSSDLSSLLDQAARLLAGACHQLGVVLAPSFDKGILTGIEFARLSDSRVLLILRVKDGLVRTVLLDVSSRLDFDTLANTASKLNECLVGLSLEEIRATLAERSKEWAFKSEEIVMRLIALGPSVFHFGEPSALYLGGTTHIVSQPEFQSPDRLKPLFEILEDRSSLSVLLEERRAFGGVHITIGRENPAGPLAATSIVTCTYSRGAMSGALGIIGPTRMSYRRVVGILQHVVRRIDCRLSA